MSKTLVWRVGLMCVGMTYTKLFLNSPANHTAVENVQPALAYHVALVGLKAIFHSLVVRHSYPTTKQSLDSFYPIIESSHYT